VTYRELQLEGLVGPTHHYAGLGSGNLASLANANAVASPREAALQSLTKMQWLHEQGAEVAVLPPQFRPRTDWLQRLQIEGSCLQEKLDFLQAEAPTLLRAVYSASAMWAANAATVTKAPDGRVHFTPANLLSSVHRVMEAKENLNLLGQIFANEEYFSVHAPIPVSGTQSDEGAANHMHLCRPDGSDGIDIFVYGAAPDSPDFPKRFIPRHMKHASKIIMEAHGLVEEDCLFWQQHPDAIDAGVFHNDVIALSHRNLLICHEQAFCHQQDVLADLRERAPWVEIKIITNTELSLESVIKSYLFNAQLFTADDGSTTIVFPDDCRNIPEAKRCCEAILAECAMVGAIAFLDLRQSMRNGGGPACLRLRVPLSEAQIAAMHQPVRYTVKLHQRLRHIIEQHYPEQLSVDDLTRPELVASSHATYRRIMDVLQLKIPAFAATYL
jgi:succinylarginine dihydrolase